MAEIPGRPVPLRFVLILSICLGCLLVHFFADTLGPAAQSFAMEWIEDGEKDAPTHAAGEDAFVLPELSSLENPQRSIRIACPESLGFSSFAFLPILPPPIAG
jgi:hypothetical protein